MREKSTILTRWIIAEGWRPYLVRNFLVSEGLRTNDFHASGYKGEWVGDSPYIDLDEQLRPNQVIFNLKGREGVVERLELSGWFLHDFDTEEAHDRLGEIELLLVQKALNQTLIKRYIEHYPNGQGYETVFTLTRGLDTGAIN